MSDQLSWVDNKLVQRLQSRLVQPGVVQLDMGRSVVSRMEKMVKPQSLVQALGQRWQSALTSQGDYIPFVYAQPPQMEAETAVSPTQSISQTPPTQKPTASPAQAEPELILAQEQRPSSAAEPQTTKASQPLAARKKTASKTKSAQPASGNAPKETAVSPQPPLVESKPLTNKKNQQQVAPQPPSATTPTIAAAQQLPGYDSTSDLPLPVVTAKETSVPTTAVSESSLPTVAKTSTASKAKVKGIPVNPSHSANNSTVVVALQKAASTTPAMPVVPTNTKSVQTANNKAQATTQPKLTSLPRPLVKPQTAAPKAPLIFPSATPKTASGNGRTEPSIIPDNPLPFVRSAPSPSSRPSSNMPLPKTAVVSPSPPIATPASSASASGVIQRQPDDDQTASDMSDMGQEPVDINEIVAEVQRQFKRELAIEGERRGATSWY